MAIKIITKPLVSIIIIFFNEEKFLAEAISSVFAQSYTNWEILLVDDGSQDGSTEIAKLSADQYRAKVRYLEHEGHGNRGMSTSRNLGLRHAAGDYVAFLDADDVWLSHKLERQLAVMDSQPEAGMTYGATQLWYSWTGRREDRQRDSLQSITVQPDTLVRPLGLLSLFLARKAITPCPSDVLLRRQIVVDVGGFEDSFRGLYEDQVFFAKVTYESPVFVSGECWSKHRQHANSSCSIWKKTGEYYSAEPNLAFLNWMQKYLDSKKLNDPEIRKVLQKRIWRYQHSTIFRYTRQAQHLINISQNRLETIVQRSLPLPFRRWLQAQRNSDTR